MNTNPCGSALIKIFVKIFNCELDSNSLPSLGCWLSRQQAKHLDRRCHYLRPRRPRPRPCQCRCTPPPPPLPAARPQSTVAIFTIQNQFDSTSYIKRRNFFSLTYCTGTGTTTIQKAALRVRIRIRSNPAFSYRIIFITHYRINVIYL